MDRSRSILFGYVAVQKGVVTLPEMLEAHNVWNQQPTESLDRVLLQHGYISQEEYQLIKTDVENCWQSYHSDYATVAQGTSSSELESPALIDTLPPDQITIDQATIDQAQNAPTPREKNEGLLSATIDYSLEQTTLPGSVGNNRTAGTRFRIIRPHARGGLGEVSVAEDKELKRKVALKEIQPRFAQDVVSKTRFVQEAEVTGRLEHPGIVPVYGFGEFADGRPYYAMRFIEGESLKDAADSWHNKYSPNLLPKTAARESKNATAPIDYLSLEFRGLLGRLIDVAQAIEYAHSRGVLHRDLKPSNIMLGKYGETLVVDWGLAKVRDLPDQEKPGLPFSLSDLADPSTAMSMTGAALGTPAFMPPEQASGKWDQVGPASDVYALGSTLYYLLTGHTPVKADNMRELLEKVMRGEIVPPTNLQPSIPKPLEAICMKAMALKPNDRYLSSKDFAADIELFLADEATTAYKEPLGLRAKRWARKHPKSVASLTATLLAGLVSVCAIALIINQKNEQLALSLTRETNLRTAAVNAQNLAERNREVAEDQSRLSRDTLSSIVYDLQGGLEDIPGGSEIRRRLLTTSLEKLGGISEQFVEKSIVDVNSYQALTDMGDVVLRFGSGNLQFSDTTGTEPSSDQKPLLSVVENFFKQALRIAEQISAEQPNDLTHKQRLVIALDNMGKVRWRQGDRSAAMALFERGSKLAEEYVQAQPEDYRGLNTLGITLERLYVAYSNLAEPLKANDLLKRKLEIDLKLTQQRPDEPKLQRDLHLTYGNLAKFHRSENSLVKAEEYSRHALQLAENLSQLQPDSVMAQRDLASCLMEHGNLCESQNKLEEARSLYERSTVILQDLVAKDPSDLLTKNKWSTLHKYFEELEMALMRFPNAAKYSKIHIELQREIATANSEDIGAQNNLASALNSAIKIHMYLENMELTNKMIAEQINFVDSLRNRFPNNLDIRLQWVAARLTAAKALLSQSDFKSSERYILEAKPILDSLREDFPDHEDVLWSTANLNQEEANLLLQTNRLDEAKESIASALLIYDGLKDKQDVVDLCLELSATIYMRQLDFEEAEKVLQRKLALETSLLDSQPGVFHVRHNQTVTFSSLAEVYLNLQQREKCIAMLERTLESRRALAAEDPAYIRNLAKTCNTIGELYWQLGDLEKARSLLVEGLRLREEQAEPTSHLAQTLIVANLERLGLLDLQSGENVKAIESFRRGIQICAEMQKLEPSDPVWPNNIGLFFRRIGDAHQKLEEWDQAEGAFLQAVDALEKTSPLVEFIERAGELATSYERLAALKNLRQQPVEALKYCESSLAIRKKIQTSNDRELVNLRNLLFLYHQFGDAYRKNDQWDEAISSFEEGLKLCQDMQQRDLVYGQSKDDLDSFEAEREYTNDLKLALGDWGGLQALQEEKRLALLAIRSYEFGQRGKFASSVEAATALIDVDSASGDQLFNAAYDICIAIQKRESDPALFSNADSSPSTDQWRSKAMTALQKAVQRGFMDWEALRTEKALEPLRRLPEYEKLFP
jgi:eukaryotic-like serine/threonine-protein kinase